MLTRLFVDNYRCLVNFEFRPRNKQLIIGSNGTGKSTVFDILSLLRDFSVHGLPCDGRLGGETRTRWLSGVDRQRFELDVAGNFAGYHYTLVVDDWGSPARPRIVEESVECGGEPVFHFKEGEVHLFNDRHEDKVQYPFDWHRSALATVQERPENTKLIWFKRWLGNLLQVQINPWAIRARSEQEATEPERDLSDFADWYRHLKLERGAEVQKALDDLKDVIPGLESLDAKEAGMNVRIVQAAIRSEHDGKLMHFALHDLSEGQRALIALYVLLHCAVSDESTVVIDEPDNFVALAEIQPWLLKLLDSIDDYQAQVIFASHHPELLNQLASQGGVIFERPDGLHTRVKDFEASDDSGLTPAEIVARGWESG
jgi:predicted ATPase